MDTNKLLNKLKDNLNCRTDTDLASALGKKASQISTWRRKSNLTEHELASLVMSARKRSIETKPLFDKLKHKLNIKKNKILGNRLGVSESTISQFVNQKYINPEKLPTLFKNAIAGGEANALRFPIKPIVEYYPCEPTLTTHGKYYDVFDKKDKIGKGLADVLKEHQGIYLFYDSQYQSLYIGKTESGNLLDEMKNAFNREREHQKAYRAKHDGYKNGSEFIPAFERANKIVGSPVYLYEIAKYFSAYWVDERLVNDIEALLIRCFANDVSNVRMEKFAKVRTQ